MGQAFTADVDDTDLPLQLTVSQDGVGGILALAPTVALRLGNTATMYLDWNDLTFKAIGWVQRLFPLVEVGDGHYYTTVNLPALVGLAEGDILFAEYAVDDGAEIVGVESNLIVVRRGSGTAAHIVVAFGDGTNDLRIKAWLDRDSTTVVAPTAITLVWRNTDGTILFTLTEADAIVGQNPDGQGVYAFQRTQALVDDVAYYVDITITDALGAVTSTRGIETIAP